VNKIRTAGSIILVLALTLWIQTQNLPAQQANGARTVILDDFEDNRAGTWPKKWYERDGKIKVQELEQSEREKFRYKVVEENNNRFLRYEGTRAKHINFPLIDEDRNNIYDINIYETPILSWKVRAHDLPVGANENEEGKNDSVASVYVVFEMGRVALVKRVPKSIRYTWSSTLEEGTEISTFFGKQKIKVVKSGKEDLGEWVTFEVNLVEDYRRMYGDDPPENPMAILIMSDGNSTDTHVKADYDDIMLKPE
jgi:hypothetical protein